MIKIWSDEQFLNWLDFGSYNHKEYIVKQLFFSMQYRVHQLFSGKAIAEDVCNYCAAILEFLYDEGIIDTHDSVDANNYIGDLFQRYEEGRL